MLALGGDNSITFAVAHGACADGLITLDAHHDLRDGRSNGSPVRRLVESGLDGRRVVQIGISDFANSAFYAARARELGITVISREELERRPIADAMAEALEIAGGGPTARIHVDLDVDVCDRAVAPACPASVPGGISARELRTAARAAGADPRVVSLDITEVDASGRRPRRPHRPAGRPVRAGDRHRRAAPEAAHWRRALATSPSCLARLAGDDGCMPGEVPGAGGTSAASLRHSRQRVRGVRVMVQGALWLAGQGVPGGAPGSGRGTWSAVVGGDDGPHAEVDLAVMRPAQQGQVRQVGVPAGGPVLHVVGLAGLGGDRAAGDDAARGPGRPAPGAAPGSRSGRSARRPAGSGSRAGCAARAAIRAAAERPPTCPPSPRRRIECRRCVGSRHRAAASRRRVPSARPAAQELGDGVGAVPRVDHDRGDQRVAGGEPGLGVRSGCAPGRWSTPGPRGWWTPG